MAPDRRLALHARALTALADCSDHARLAHHAEAAGDAGAVLRFAPEAAQRAAALGAHRESAAQYGRALRFVDAVAPDRQAVLLEGRSYECMLTDQIEDSLRALRRAIAVRRELGDVRAEGCAATAVRRALVPRARCRGARCRQRGGGGAGRSPARSRAGDGVLPSGAAVHGCRGRR
jgi:hypothetical protein